MRWYRGLNLPFRRTTCACLLENHGGELSVYQAARETEPSAARSPTQGFFRSGGRKVGLLATSGSPHVLVTCWRWLLLVGCSSRAFRVFSAAPDACGGIQEGRAVGSPLEKGCCRWETREDLQVFARRDLLAGEERRYSCCGDPTLPAAILQSPALDEDAGAAMEGREPPPRCGTGKGRDGRRSVWKGEGVGQAGVRGDERTQEDEGSRGRQKENPWVRLGRLAFARKFAPCEERSGAEELAPSAGKSCGYMAM